MLQHERSNQPSDKRNRNSPQIAGHDATRVVSIPLLSIRPGPSPRLNGVDAEHVARLAETETALPPILVDKRTMQLIDGAHRVMAASLQGRETIDAVFFEGSEAEAFVYAVRENIAHGLPLSQADRNAAAQRIIASCPHLSDRAIGQAAGLTAKTVAAIRKRAGHGATQPQVRVGTDGKARPLNGKAGRRRAAELLTQHPGASLREVAKAAGISPTTVLDVRRRLARGEQAAPEGQPPASRTRAGQHDLDTGAGTSEPVQGKTADTLPHPRMRRLSAPSSPPSATVQKLLRDPALRGNEKGRELLRLLHISAIGAEQLPDAVIALPAHRVETVARLAQQFAKAWQDFAQELASRARVSPQSPY